WPTSEAEYPHLAFAYYADQKTLAIPVGGRIFAPGAGNQPSELWVLQVDPATGFRLLGQVRHADQVRRSLRIEDKLYSVGTDSVKVQPLDRPATPLAEVTLKTDLVPNQYFVSALYRNLLARDADGAGLAAWTALLDRGVPRGIVSTAVAQSGEYRTRVVNDLYRRALG